MSKIRRGSALGLASVVVCAFLVAIPAGAQDSDTVVTAPEAFIASSSSRALNIGLFGNNITIGASKGLIDSSPKADAQGAGVLLVSGTIANALATGLNQTQTPAPACVINLPLLGVLTLLTACGEAKATTVDGFPQAAATGTIADIDVGGSLLTPLLQQVGSLLGNTVGQVVGTLDTILGGLLNPLLGALNLNLQSTVDQLFAGLQQVTSLLKVRVGPSASQAITTASKVNALGIAQGASIQLLPGLTALGAPLATITVGQAQASVDVTRPAASQSGAVTAVAVPSFQAALVQVDLGLPLLGNVTSIPVGLGSPLTLLQGTILESTIAVGAGSTGDGPNGSKFAVADGVKLELLKGLSGGIVLELAHAEAAGGGLSAQFRIQERQKPVIVPQELPRTGAGSAWIPMAGLGLLLAAFGTRRLVRVRARR